MWDTKGQFIKKNENIYTSILNTTLAMKPAGNYEPVWQSSGNSKNGSGSSGGTTSLMELEPF